MAAAEARALLDRPTTGRPVAVRHQRNQEEHGSSLSLFRPAADTVGFRLESAEPWPVENYQQELFSL